MRAARSLFLTMLLPSFLLVACSDKAEQAIADAEALTFERRPDEALRRYEDALLLLAKKTGPHNESLLLKALIGAGNLSYLDLQELRAALGYFQTVVQLFPSADEAVEAHLALAEIHRAQGDTQSAIAQLLSLCQDFPEHPDSDRHLLLLARGYMAHGNHEQAIVEADLLLRRHPESHLAAEAMMLRGNAFGLLQRPQDAIDAYAAIVQRWPNSALASQARYDWGKLLIGLKRDEEAEALLMAALRFHPQPRLIQRDLAGIRERLMRRKATPLNSLQALGAGH